MATLTVLNGPTIFEGESLSEALDCTGGDLVRITMPMEWDNAPVTFQASTDNVGYNDLYNPDGHELMLTCVAGAGILLPSAALLGIGWLKVRSGTVDSPIPQSGQRTFAVTIRS
jgi:hypothetical protein